MKPLATKNGYREPSLPHAASDGMSSSVAKGSGSRAEHGRAQARLSCAKGVRGVEAFGLPEGAAGSKSRLGSSASIARDGKCASLT